MNKFLIFAFIFALTNCYLYINKCTTGIAGYNVHIDTTNKDYKYNVEFDWTDEEEINFKVPIYADGVSISESNVIPLFINASTIDKFDTGKTIKSSETADNDEGNIATILVYDKYPAYYPFDADISNSEISAKIKSKEVQANKNDVTQKFIKYFAIAYCSDVNEVTLKRFDNILVTVNNGNYFSTSKILLACLALLFL